MNFPDVNEVIGEIAERLKPQLNANTRLVGIHSGGVWVAEKLREQLGVELPFGSLDISFYRDDFSRIGLNPKIKPSNIPFEVDDAEVILVDDVLYTGRTVRAAMNELFDYGRPSKIILVVLVDRGCRELPIAAQITGFTTELSAQENIRLNRDEQGQLSLILHGENADSE